MKKFRANKKRGFTLVECIVAIAVFAIMAAMILVIMSGAVTTSKRAADAEENLNELVESVVQDNSKHNYNASNSNTLKMYFDTGSDNAPSGPNFSMTFTTVDGYKNYVTCPYCGEFNNLIDYLFKIYDTTTFQTQYAANQIKVGVLFNPAEDTVAVSRTPGEDVYLSRLVCPHCENVIYASTDGATTTLADFICGDCGAKSTIYGSSSKFAFNAVSNSFICTECGGGNVSQLLVVKCESCGRLGDDDNGQFNYNASTGEYTCVSCGGKGIPNADTNGTSDFSVGNMYPNAIRYTNIDQPDETALEHYVEGELVGLSTDLYDTAHPMQVAISYSKTSTAGSGKYTLTIPTIANQPLNSFANLKINLPYNYVFSLAKVIDPDGSTTDYLTDPDNESGASTIDVIYTPGYAASKTPGLVEIKNIPKASGSLIIEFTLNNYKTGSSFDDDYAAECEGSKGALMEYWFKAGKNLGQFSVPRTF